MINTDKNRFTLQTKKTTYLFAADESGYLFHLYYGASIPTDGNVVKALYPKMTNQIGCAVIADTDYPNLALDDLCLEVSGRGHGDMREPFIDLIFADGSQTTDFRYVNHKTFFQKQMPPELPGALDTRVKHSEAVSLLVTLKDRDHDVYLDLIYSVFEECDCITRFAVLRNESSEPVRVRRLMSAQLDTQDPGWKVTVFHGDWAREMEKKDVWVHAGKFISDTCSGNSSNRANPFVMFSEPDTTETSGACFASNLIYSGNHRESFEVGGHGKMRMLTGIHPDTFEWMLNPREQLASPEAVLTYAGHGYQELSIQMHQFVREHIVRGSWQKKTRPILINSWEAMYFQVNEKKLLKLAKTAKTAGVELFVLDDGWFGHRDDDRSSLGDWSDYQKKLPSGLAGLSQKIHELDMLFGIWVEPEMVNEDSDLYRIHPDWAVCIPGQMHSLGRNQMILDLSQEAVQEYLIASMTDVFTRGKVDYVKWDMNRNMSDYFSQGLSANRQGEFAHRYILGLYRILEALTAKFPNILFEACASGGNRFDLGMLCYMPQIWASDNTDAMCRTQIQEGYSYGYPQSIVGAHVSGCPNHQTLRVTPLATRFAVASAGVLGYECNLCDAGAADLAEIKQQVAVYKEWRSVLQFGQFYRLKRTGDHDAARWMIVSPDQENAVVIRVQGQNRGNDGHHRIQLAGLAEDKVYRFSNRPQKVDIHRMGDLVNTIAPVHVRQDSLVHDVLAKFVKLDGEQEEYLLPGRVMNQAEITLADSYAGTGFGENTAVYQDYDARMYFVTAE